MSNTQQSKQNGKEFPKFIVLDIVFYGSSLNYDQGVGNYQELKKITLWNGKQHTLVSRYALRYSILQTGKGLSNNSEVWKLADGSEFERAKKKEEQKEKQGGTIQPSLKVLLEGKVLEYPELNLFGYLITTTGVQNFREAPVKISHAISLTPFNYDTHFCANIWLARRLVEAGMEASMSPNPFILEEHQTFYVYSVVIDVERLAEYEIYLTPEDEREVINSLSGDERLQNLKNEIKRLLDRIKNKANDEDLEEARKRINSDFFRNSSVEIKEIRNLKNKVLVIKYGFKEEYKIGERVVKKEEKIKELLETLIKAIINLRREIKGRVENLSPKVLVVGVYYDGNYDTYKDRIYLSSQYEEEYEEEVKENGSGKKTVIKRVIKSSKPLFRIFADGNIIKKEETLSSEALEEGVLKFIFGNDEAQNSPSGRKPENYETKNSSSDGNPKNECEHSKPFDTNKNANESGKTVVKRRIEVFHTPDVEVVLEKTPSQDGKSNQTGQEQK